MDLKNLNAQIDSRNPKEIDDVEKEIAKTNRLITLANMKL